MEMERTCHFCNEKFITNHYNHGIIYKENKIYVCKECMYITVICYQCGKEIFVKFSKKDKKCFCSKKCICKNMLKMNKENGKSLYDPIVRSKGHKKAQENMKLNKIGIYNLKIREKAIKSSIKSQKLNKTGLYSSKVIKLCHTSKIEKNRTKIMKTNKTGLYALGVAAKAQETQKKNGTNFYDNKIREKGIIVAHKIEANEKRKITQKKNGTGIYNPNNFIKINNILKLNIKKFLAFKITINLFIENSFNEIISADYSSFSYYNNIPGIWAVYGKNLDNIKICLDVCQTKDIGNEMRLGLRKLIAQKNNKYKEFVKYKDIIFIPVKLNIMDFEKREAIKALYAIKYNSLYWSPSPTQLKLLKMKEKEFNDYILLMTEKDNINFNIDSKIEKTINL